MQPVLFFWLSSLDWWRWLILRQTFNLAGHKAEVPARFPPTVGFVEQLSIIFPHSISNAFSLSHAHLPSYLLSLKVVPTNSDRAPLEIFSWHFHSNWLFPNRLRQFLASWHFAFFVALRLIENFWHSSRFFLLKAVAISDYQDQRAPLFCHIRTEQARKRLRFYSEWE